MVSAGAASNRCITGACAYAPTANVIDAAVASGNAGRDAVGVAKASASDDQYIGVFAGAPAACVARVLAEGAGG